MLKKVFKGLTRWWHYSPPGVAYMVKVVGKEYPSTVLHKTRGKARREAVRVAKITGLPTYVTMTVEVVLPQQKAPAPEIHILPFDGQGEDWFNWTAEGYPKDLFDKIVAGKRFDKVSDKSEVTSDPA